MTLFSLRGTISILAAGAVAVVAIITLSITLTLTTSLSALRDIGKTHSASLLANAVGATEHFFATPVLATETIRNFSLREAWQWPSDDQNTLRLFANVALTQLLTCGKSCTLNVYFADSTQITLVGLTSEMYAGYMRYGAPYSNGGLAYQLTQPVTVETFGGFWSNHSVVRAGRAESTAPRTLIRNDGIWNDVLLRLTGGGRSTAAAGIIVVRHRRPLSDKGGLAL